ncbi:hypothetical protein BU23DRAFT_569760 [Bimuria novae-zelandiae CBS 107.79]|uniref:BTB domain-containing protein n=1 Tax=Bimuria novae-zelandiae CBS 107.79 TaxID=1447943 RepID=A0A6A5V3A5_9PLEO|nr:hypothetical protein BU23DRAFT_569760 [Bimuria novae-zelandiae CBS 107.79]
MAPPAAADTSKKKAAPPVDVAKYPHASEPPLPEAYFSPIVTIEFGPKSKFVVHKGLLEYYSGYFRAALKESWAQGTDKIVHLPKEYAIPFEIFHHWIRSHCTSALLKDGKIPLSLSTILKTWVWRRSTYTGAL